MKKKNFLLYSSFPNIISINEILNPKISYSKFDINFKNYKFSNKFILNDLFFIKSQDRLNLIPNKKYFLNLEKNILKFTNLINKQNKKKKIIKNIIFKKIKILYNQLSKKNMIKINDLTSLLKQEKLILEILDELERKKINLKKLKLFCSKLFDGENGSGINYFVFIKDAIK